MKDVINRQHDRYQRFCADWLRAWNDHDIERIVAHYTDPVTIHSPFLQSVQAGLSGTPMSLAQLRTVYGRAFTAFPDLHFEPINIFAGTDSVVCHYRSVNGLLAAETFFLDAQDHAHLVACHYADWAGWTPA
jgi:hypothetical protein